MKADQELEQAKKQLRLTKYVNVGIVAAFSGSVILCIVESFVHFKTSTYLPVRLIMSLLNGLGQVLFGFGVTYVAADYFLSQSVSNSVKESITSAVKNGVNSIRISFDRFGRLENSGLIDVEDHYTISTIERIKSAKTRIWIQHSVFDEPQHIMSAIEHSRKQNQNLEIRIILALENSDFYNERVAAWRTSAITKRASANHELVRERVKTWLTNSKPIKKDSDILRFSEIGIYNPLYIIDDTCVMGFFWSDKSANHGKHLVLQPPTLVGFNNENSLCDNLCKDYENRWKSLKK
jgi:hypothetical protein